MSLSEGLSATSDDAPNVQSSPELTPNVRSSEVLSATSDDALNVRSSLESALNVRKSEVPSAAPDDAPNVPGSQEFALNVLTSGVLSAAPDYALNVRTSLELTPNVRTSEVLSATFAPSVSECEVPDAEVTPGVPCPEWVAPNALSAEVRKMEGVVIVPPRHISASYDASELLGTPYTH